VTITEEDVAGIRDGASAAPATATLTYTIYYSVIRGAPKQTGASASVLRPRDAGARAARRHAAAVLADLESDHPQWRATSLAMWEEVEEVMDQMSPISAGDLRLLRDLEAAAEAVRAAEQTLAERVARRDDLIRAALRTEFARSAIASAAGVGEKRLYQIRDRRR